MSATRLAVTLTLFALVVGDPLAQTPSRMPTSEIRPGMVGIGRTVFVGTKLDEFKVEILGVLENVVGPRRSLILARLDGGPLANAGVIAGMSGSPVYIDGRMIGAVSYALGQFSKEPIAGITPIDEMVDATAVAVRPAAARVRVDAPLTPENLADAFRQALAWDRPFANRAGDARLTGGAAVADFASGDLGTLLRPIASPLLMSGFEPQMSETLASAFAGRGFVPTTGGSTAGAAETSPAGPLRPGDAVGVMLVNGDLQLGATGTVTDVVGDRVYAFGHPLYNLGPIEFPMTRAHVYTVLPSLASSVKLSGTGEIIGTVLQDRATAIAGRLGPGPNLVPIKLVLESDRGPSRTFNFGVVNDQLFTPLLAYASILSTLTSYERQFGAATFSVRGKAVLKNHGEITFNNLFSGDQPSIGAATYVVAPITFLMGNDQEKVDVEGVELTISSVEQSRRATIERVWLDDPRPRAGRTVPLKILLRTYRGDEVLRTLPIEIPTIASGTLSLLVTDASRLAQLEQREMRTAPQLQTVPQFIRALNRAPRNNALYVRLLGSNAGAVVNGERLSSLPPSVLAVLESDRNGGNFNPLYSATLGAWELSTEQAVSGTRTLAVTISQD